MRRASFGAVLLGLLLPACVSGNYGADSIDEPFAAERLAALQPGNDTLASCLHALGAPNRVFEYHVDSDGSSGMALLWYWRQEVGWGVEVSSPSDQVPASASYGASDAQLPGCVLWFGKDLVLEMWRTGAVGDLLPHRVRPSVPDA